jgi:hypothetical protein
MADWVWAWQSDPFSQGFVENITASRVPAPGTLAVFAAGLAALGFARRRFRRHA